MSTTTYLSADRLAELLVIAAAYLSGECSSAAQLSPLGVPVRPGRGCTWADSADAWPDTNR